MSQESKELAAKAQKFSAKRLGDMVMNNMLIIIMVVAAVGIAIYKPGFVSPSSLVNIPATGRAKPLRPTPPVPTCGPH